MKKQMILVLLLAIQSIAVNAQCIDFSGGEGDTMGFEDYQNTKFELWTIVDKDSNDTTWVRTSERPYSGDYSIEISQYNHDWLFSQCIEFDTGLYEIIFWYSISYPLLPNQSFMICLASDPNEGSISDTLLDVKDFKNVVYNDTNIILKIENQGIYNIGIYAYGASAYGYTKMYFDDIIFHPYSCENVSIDIGQDTTICAGDSILLSPGNGYSEYLWNNNSTSSSITVDSGIYSITVTDDWGCQASDSITISYYDLPGDSLIVDGNTTFCTGDSTVLKIDLENSYCKNFNIIWYNLDTFVSVDTMITVKHSGNYVYFIEDTLYGCVKRSDTLIIEEKTPYLEEICMVTFDSFSGANKIIWNKTYNEHTKYYNIYRESYKGDSFINIGSVFFSEPGYFIDTNSNPEVRSYKYMIATVDSCNNSSGYSDFHTTLHLLINLGIDNSINLYWNSYWGTWYSEYYIYRGSDPDSMLVLDTIPYSNNTYTDINVPSGNIFYQIAILPLQECDPYRTSNNLILSNMTSNKNLTLVENSSKDFVIYPNPAKDILKIRKNTLDNVDIIIYSIDNKSIMTIKNIDLIQEINLENLPRGIYLLELISKNGRYISKIVLI